MFGLLRLRTFKLQTCRNICRVLNFHQYVTSIYILLTLCFLHRIQTLDVDSALCRCTTSTKFGRPFVVLWNSPTGGCHVNFSVHIELEKYGILTNSNQSWDGEVVTVFYNAQLGLYPYYRYDDKKRMLNDGLPQLVNLTEHLKKASQNIAEKIPEPNYSGLAVIDWEGWRPLWEMNFGKKRLYQSKSIALVKKEGILNTKKEIHVEAKKRFQRAGKRMMMATISLGKKLRPRALWGFYGFPDCHGNVRRAYHCNGKNKKWNNKLRWLYKSSTALFPSIYLMDEHVDNGKVVAEKLNEAFRVSKLASDSTHGHQLPVFPYLRPLYHFGAREFKMLTEDDLENAVGQAVDYGSAGLILWGNHYDERTSREICLKYNNYVNNKLGPYISLLTEEVETCSREKCSSNGRCIDTSVANVKDGSESCRSLFKYGTVFKMGNATLADHQANGRATLRRIKTKLQRIKTKYQRLFDKNKTATQVTSKQNKTMFTERVGDHESLPSIHNTTKADDMFYSSPNITQTKHGEPVWNKNAILGFKKKQKVNYTERKRKTGGRITFGDVLRNRTGSEGDRMLNGKGINSEEMQQEIGTKTSNTNPNTTSSNKHNHPSAKRNRKPGYSARSGEETAVQVPGVYIILITVTLGGALLMTVIYVAIYYTVNVRGRSHDHSHDYEYGSGDENPFSVEPNSPWWNDDGDPAEKLLKKTKE